MANEIIGLVNLTTGAGVANANALYVQKPASTIITESADATSGGFYINRGATGNIVLSLPTSPADGDVVEVSMEKVSIDVYTNDVNFFYDGGSASGSGDLNGSWTAAGVPAGGTWIGPGSSQWWKYDAGAVVKNKLTAMSLGSWGDGGGIGLKAFTLYGSNDDSNWTSIYSGTHANSGSVEAYSFTNNTYYRYYKLTDFQSWRGDGIVALNMTANASRGVITPVTINVDPPSDVQINNQTAGVTRLFSAIGDYEKYRFDGAQWRIIGSYGTPTIGS